MKLKFNKIYFVLALLFFTTEACIALFLKTGFIRHTFGDYLAVIMVYTVIKSIVDIKVWPTAIFVLILSFIVEFLQLTPFLEVLNLHNSKSAVLILGNSFQFTDLLAYTLGIITILHIETNYNENIKNTYNSQI